MRRLFVAGTETFLLFSVGVVAVFIRFTSEAANEIVNNNGWLKLLLASVVIQVAFYLFDLYDLPAMRSYRQVVTNLAKALGVATVMLMILFYALPMLTLGRGVFLVNLGLAFAVLSLWRLLVSWSSVHPHLGLRERVLILGSGKQAIEIARATLERSNAGFHIIGFADDKPELVGKSLINPSVLGLTDDLYNLVELHEIHRIVVAVEDRRGKLPTGELLNLSLSGRVAVEDCAGYYERLTGKISTEILRPSWLIFSRGHRYTDLAHHIRRLLNVALAAVGFTVSLPIMVLVAFVVKLDSRGPIFYVQERVGKNGRLFKIIKFRSMRSDAEEESGPVWAETSDPRVTRIGKIIRKLRLDELPQFVNVLRGDMNFVGPRPERTVFVDQLNAIIPYYSQRHLIASDRMGADQVSVRFFRGDAIESFATSLLRRNQSFLLDAIIMFETIKTVLFSRGSR
jgi:sugar transferase (PEP-CTERM system associated)